MFTILGRFSFLRVHETPNGNTLNGIIHLTFAGGQISAFSSPLFHANGKWTRINRKNVTKNLGVHCIITVVRCELILEYCVTMNIQNSI